MKKVIKVLHLASFDGNIGDNANHNGARRLLSHHLPYEFQYTNLEIREFYWKQRAFDDNFIELANQHDLLMIGGGNYFELWVEQSATGTTIDLSHDALDQIKPPILFHALGCDPEKGIADKSLEKFRSFLDRVLHSPKYMVSVRNDGSIHTIDKYFGWEYADRIHRVPDGGFFTEVEDHFHPELPRDKQIVAINVAGDMLDRRFLQEEPGRIGYEEFLSRFSSLLNEQFADNPDLHAVFIPHIFRDLTAISDVLERLEDQFRRRRVAVAPYLHGEGSEKYVFDLYRKCDLIMGMRFHTNVCGIGFHVPTIGLVNYPLLGKMYNEIGCPERVVRVNEADFEIRLRELMISSLSDSTPIVNKYASLHRSLQEDIRRFHESVLVWLRLSIS